MGRIKGPMAERASAMLKRSQGCMRSIRPAYTCVSGGGASWILRYSFAGERRDLGLGSCRDLSLEQAGSWPGRSANWSGKVSTRSLRSGKARHRPRWREPTAHVPAMRGRLPRCPQRRLEECQAPPASMAQHAETYACPIVGTLNVAAVDTVLVCESSSRSGKKKLRRQVGSAAASKTCWTGPRSVGTGRAITRRAGAATLTSCYRRRVRWRRWNTIRPKSTIERSAPSWRICASRRESARRRWRSSS